MFTNSTNMTYEDFQILIVDDLDDNRDLLRLDLEDELPKVQLHEARNGTEALQALEKNRYSLVLCDLMMPDIDGFTVYEKAKQMTHNVNLPFIFISANQEHFTAIKGLELGAIDFLKKPYDIAELILKSRNLCRLKQTYDNQEDLILRFEETNRKLEESNKQKDEVLRIVSHDMRNPLGNIIGLAQVLNEEPDQEIEEIENITEIIIKSGENLLGLVNNLLDVAKLDAGKIDLQLTDYDLIFLINSEIEQFKYSAKQKSIKFKFETEFSSCIATIDPPKIKQSIANIISNAIKFSTENTTITISLKIDEDHVIIKVRDEGIGLDEDKLTMAFEKFSQVQRSGTMNEKGSGLGLSIVKAFIGLHQGEVYLESALNKGTTVTIVIPLTQESNN